MSNALVFLIDTFSKLYLLILLMRFWLPLLRASFQNPVAQGVLRYTSPLVNPVRRVVPSIGRIDTATVLIAVAIQYLATLLMLVLSGVDISMLDGRFLLMLIPQSFIALVDLSIILFIVAIIIRVILSWFQRDLGGLSFALHMLTEPLLSRARRLIPPIGVIDLSAYIVIVLLWALRMVLNDVKLLLV